MEKTIDAGEIYYTETFDVTPFETCETLYGKAEIACLSLLEKFAAHIYQYGNFPPPSSMKWACKAFTGKEFQQWLVLNPENREEFEKKIKAAKHSKFPGPFILVNEPPFQTG